MGKGPGKEEGGRAGEDAQALTDALNTKDLLEVLHAVPCLDLEQDEHGVVRAREVVARGHARAPRELRERVPEPAHALRREARGGDDRGRLRARVYLRERERGVSGAGDRLRRFSTSEGASLVGGAATLLRSSRRSTLR